MRSDHVAAQAPVLPDLHPDRSIRRLGSRLRVLRLAQDPRQRPAGGLPLVAGAPRREPARALRLRRAVALPQPYGPAIQLRCSAASLLTRLAEPCSLASWRSRSEIRAIPSH